MTVIIAIAIFLVVGGITWKYPTKIPSWIYKNLEYFLVVIALIGILTAIAQIESESKKLPHFN